MESEHVFNKRDCRFSLPMISFFVTDPALTPAPIPNTFSFACGLTVLVTSSYPANSWISCAIVFSGPRSITSLFFAPALMENCSRRAVLPHPCVPVINNARFSVNHTNLCSFCQICIFCIFCIILPNLYKVIRSSLVSLFQLNSQVSLHPAKHSS